MPYREDPTIAIWELMNEPEPPDDASILVEWVDEMAAFVKSVGTLRRVPPRRGYHRPRRNLVRDVR